MVSAHLRKSLGFALLFFFLGTIPAVAQSPLDPAQLPSRTVFYFLWRGTPPSEARKASSLLSLWDDPDFAPVRSALFESMVSTSPRDKSSPSLSPEEFTEYSTLLDNAFVAGYLGEPKGHRSAVPADAAPAANPWNGFFFVYDRSGKEALLAKAILRMRSQEKEIPRLSPLMIAGIPALKVETKSGATYWGEIGKFAVSAKERSVFEEILSRAAGKSPDSFSLAQNSYYQEAQPLLGKGLVEFFLRVADLRDIIRDSSPSGAKTAMLLDAVKLNSFHSLSFRLSLEGAKTRVQGALLGDASSGTLFDIFSEGQQIPGSFAYLSPDTVYYQETQLNLPGMYETIKRAMRTALPPDQQGGTDMLESLARQRLGMPLEDALALPTGEFGSLQTSGAMDPAKQVYFLGVQKKPESLRLIRSILGERISSERNEGSTTYVKISLQASQSSSGVAQWNFYHLAVTPSVILGAAQMEPLRAMLAQRQPPAAATPFTATPAFLAARAQFPEKLSGFGYMDFQKLDWPALKLKWIALLKTPPGRQPAGAKSASPQEPPGWLIRLNPQTISRHLHTATSASWKDAKGVHFDEWLD
jgi:hypothetical protein